MKYDKEFKEQALKLSDEIGVKKAAEKLGLRINKSLCRFQMILMQRQEYDNLKKSYLNFAWQMRYLKIL